MYILVFSCCFAQAKRNRWLLNNKMGICSFSGTVLSRSMCSAIFSAPVSFQSLTWELYGSGKMIAVMYVKLYCGQSEECVHLLINSALLMLKEKLWFGQNAVCSNYRLHDVWVIGICNMHYFYIIVIIDSPLGVIEYMYYICFCLISGLVILCK